MSAGANKWLNGTSDVVKDIKCDYTKQVNSSTH